MCDRCNFPIADQYLAFPGFGYFNVAEAIRILQEKPRAPFELSGRKLAYMLPGSVDEKHLKHVDTSHPGIIGSMPGMGTVLIDGNHRATKLARANQPAQFYKLTPAETKRCHRKRAPK